MRICPAATHSPALDPINGYVTEELQQQQQHCAARCHFEGRQFDQRCVVNFPVGEAVDCLLLVYTYRVTGSNFEHEATSN